MDPHDKLYIDKWFKLPPKLGKTLVAFEISERRTGKRHAKKSRQSPVKKESKKRG